MKSEDQVWSVLVEANPVRDVDAYGRQQVDDTAHLATPDTRSSEMVQVDKGTAPSKEKKGAKTRWLVAAAVLAVAGVTAIVLAQNNGEAPIATEPPPSTPTPSTEAAPTPAAVRLLMSYAEARNAGDIGEAMSLFYPDKPMKRHPLGGGSAHYMDRSSEIRALESMIPEVQGSGAGIEFIDIEVGDPDSVAAPSVTFNWKFHYGADGSESGGEAGCIGGRDAKAWIRNGLFQEFDWGFDDPTMCVE